MPHIHAGTFTRAVLAIAIAVIGIAPVHAQEHSEVLRLVAGRSLVLKFDAPVERASVNSDAVADVVVVSPTQLLINAKQVGSTTLVIWRNGASEVKTILVEADLEGLRATLKEVLPKEDILASSTAGAVVLSGTVSSLAAAQQAAAISDTYAGKVVNLLEVQKGAFDALLHKLLPDEDLSTYQTEQGIVLSGTAKHPANVEKAVQLASIASENVVNIIDVPDQKQVLIEVRFAEAKRSVAKSLGIDYAIQGEDFTKASFLSGGLAPQTPSTPQFARIDPEDLSLSSAITNLIELRRGTDISVALTALEEKGLIRILAEPNLLTMSGQEASFLAGGEFPIPVVQGGGSSNNAVTIEFKEFGIRLNFKPQVASDDTIRMLVEPEVSVLDFGAAAVSIGGFEIPALVTRRASTHVQLRSGESLVIGGLISQTDTKSNNKTPFLGNIPVLGALFKSEAFQQEETELVVLVTPRLTKPTTLDLPSRYEDMHQVGRTVNDQLSAPPYDDVRADAIRDAIRPGKPEPEPVKNEPAANDDQKPAAVVPDAKDAEPIAKIDDPAPGISMPASMFSGASPVEPMPGSASDTTRAEPAKAAPAPSSMRETEQAEKRAAAKRDAERKAAEKHAAAEQKRAEKHAAAAKKAAEKQAAAEKKAADKKAAADKRAAEKSAAAQRKAAEKFAAAQRKEAERIAAAERNAAAEQLAEEERAAKENPYGWESGLWKDPESEPLASWEQPKPLSLKERFSNWMRRRETESPAPAEPEVPVELLEEEGVQTEVVYPGGYMVRDGSATAVRAYTPAP
jgi:pilus assembly protein CpaC